MAQPVSTVSDSASEEILETPQSLDEAIETGFLPDDEHYRLTGEFKTPGKKDDAASSTGKEKPAAKEGDAPPASEQDETDASKAAASATASTQRTESRRESRWEKRERELKDARAEIARLKAQPSQSQQRSESAQPSQAATETEATAGKSAAKPKIDDIDPKTKQPKYKTYAEYEDAKDTWLRQETLREFSESQAKTAQQQEFAAIDKSRAEHVEKARTSHPDYDQVVADALAEKDADGRNPIFYTTGSHIDNFLLSQPDRGVGLLYHCMKNASDPAIRQIFARIPDGSRYQLTNVEQIARLAVIAHTLTGTGTRRASQSQTQDEDDLSSARPVTRASRPPHQVSGQGTVAKDAVEQALEDGDSETYIRAQNAKQLAALKRK